MLIFDLDGTLIDSNGIWDDIDQKFLERHGLPFSQEYHDGVAHTILQNAAMFTRDFFRMEMSCEEIMAEWMELAQGAYDHVRLRPYVREYLDHCRADGQSMAIFTSCVPEHCETALRSLGLKDYFERVLYAQRLGIEKHSPETFRAIARVLGTEPDKCTLIDDSQRNCEAAKNAGMAAICVFDPKRKDEYSDHTGLVYSFKELLP